MLQACAWASKADTVKRTSTALRAPSRLLGACRLLLKSFTILPAPCATASRREGPKTGEEVEEGRTGSSHVVVPRVERQVAQRGAAQMVFDRHALRCTRPSRHVEGSDSPQAQACDTPVTTPQCCHLHSSSRQAYAACQAHSMSSENTTSPAKLATCYVHVHSRQNTP